MAPISEVNRLRSAIMVNDKRQATATVEQLAGDHLFGDRSGLGGKEAHRAAGEERQGPGQAAGRRRQPARQADHQGAQRGHGRARQAWQADDACLATPEAAVAHERGPARDGHAVLRGVRRSGVALHEEQRDPDRISARLAGRRRAARHVRRQVWYRQRRRHTLVVRRSAPERGHGVLLPRRQAARSLPEWRHGRPCQRNVGTHRSHQRDRGWRGRGLREGDEHQGRGEFHRSW